MGLGVGEEAKIHKHHLEPPLSPPRNPPLMQVPQVLEGFSKDKPQQLHLLTSAGAFSSHTAIVSEHPNTEPHC